MNYLAHLLLSPRETHAIVGNLMGDFRKHLKSENLPENLLQGIENHCRVDKYTDSHPVIKKLKAVFSKERRRFAGIILDVSFDHFLSRHWSLFNDENRTDFIQYVYGCLNQSKSVMPAKMQHAMHYMIEQDWLGSYAELTGIERSLNRMSHRIRFKNNLYGAIDEVKENDAVLEQGFLEFFPQLQKHINLQTELLNNQDEVSWNKLGPIVEKPIL